MEQWNSDFWRDFLLKAIRENDLEKLKKTLYGIQAGMDLLAKQHMATPKIQEIFADMTRSIERAAKKIFRQKYPALLDKGFSSAHVDIQEQMKKDYVQKKKRDAELAQFLRDARF